MTLKGLGEFLKVIQTLDFFFALEGIGISAKSENSIHSNRSRGILLQLFSTTDFLKFYHSGIKQACIKDRSPII